MRFALTGHHGLRAYETHNEPDFKERLSEIGDAIESASEYAFFIGEAELMAFGLGALFGYELREIDTACDEDLFGQEIKDSLLSSYAEARAGLEMILNEVEA